MRLVDIFLYSCSWQTFLCYALPFPSLLHTIRNFCFCKDNCFAYSSVFAVKSLCVLKLTIPFWFSWKSITTKRTLRQWSVSRKGRQNWSCEEWLRKLWLFSQKKKGFKGDLITLYNYVVESCRELGISLFSQLKAVRQWKLLHLMPVEV